MGIFHFAKWYRNVPSAIPRDKERLLMLDLLFSILDIIKSFLLSISIDVLVFADLLMIWFFFRNLVIVEDEHPNSCVISLYVFPFI